MREKTFERPTARKILSLNGIDLPEKITPSFISDLMQSSSVVNISGNYERAVKSVESLNHAEIALFSENFRVSKGDSNKGIKSLDYLVKIDSQQVLRNISGLDNVPNRLTRQFLEEYKIWPYTLIKEVTKSGNVENPPIGFYWVGLDGHVRSTTWIRCVAGAEMQVMRRKGDFSSRVKDKTL